MPPSGVPVSHRSMRMRLIAVAAKTWPRRVAGQATPPGADPTTVTCEETGEVLQGALDRSIPDG